MRGLEHLAHVVRMTKGVVVGQAVLQLAKRPVERDVIDHEGRVDRKWSELIHPALIGLHRARQPGGEVGHVRSHELTFVRPASSLR